MSGSTATPAPAAMVCRHDQCGHGAAGCQGCGLEGTVGRYRRSRPPDRADRNWAGRRRLQLILDVLLKAAARGEIRAEAAVPVLARTGPALIRQHTLLYGGPPARPYLEDITDRIILPAAAPPPR